MFEFTRQHPSVELVELHKLNQVGEFGGALIKAEEDLTILFALQAPAYASKRKRECEQFSNLANSKSYRHTLTATLL